ncbi:hypothetical protein [Streptomyces sp. CBMA29]|uniref:hypothetical protein n=1 Tax=Streptomyces sp. CBMA29 TaxID=1896314 RepID=UPI0016620EC4|nr:hypothetical protein [Streptomyces sp. CBMA29]
MDEIQVGDCVTHFREPQRVGTVVSIQDDRHSWDRIYNVVFIENGYAIPYRSGLTKI